MSTSLTSLIEDVYVLTNRPDLVGETMLAVRNATLKAHRTDYYYKDLLETGIQLEQALQKDSIDYKSLIPNWRALKYLRQYDYSTPPGVAGKLLEIITPENILDSYHVQKENVCYVAGMELQIRVRRASQYYLLGCYVNPDVTQAGFKSWIADEQPMAIVYEATATVFKTIGFDEQTAVYKQLVIEEYATLKISNIEAVGS